ncbi:MBL fold metallo-hydrolase [Carboxydothermus islandicus]|uniref:MBL fold metallo-hydrolase n=1 Tax=Carboxydothermus islandicus TaxID=661089 RepID=A0A1L8D0N7_9THEO|nr:MBL fold metallo-hydrolase [Carboxydothermus islandicus]GAV24745.1 MBL fold metallo-hydrolase [Carboxydothermus islandicus]
MDLEGLDRELREKTVYGIELARERFRKRNEIKNTGESFILFAGTGGNPEAVLTQNPYTAGFIIKLEQFLMWVDPGPSAIVRARELNIDLGSLTAVYISHGHQDHYGGAEPIIEGMCWGMFARRGFLLAPGKVLDDRMISPFHQGINTGFYSGGPEVVVLKALKPVEIGKVTVVPVAVYHGEENYGFILKYKNLAIGYTSDTNYILSYQSLTGIKKVERMGPVNDFLEVVDYREDLKKIFSEVDILIANVTAHNSWMHRHLTTLGLAHLLKDSKVKLAVLSHFNYCCLYPEDLRDKMARYVREKSGIKTIAGKDGLKLELNPEGV